MMRGTQRHQLWPAVLGLAVVGGIVALRPSLTPATLELGLIVGVAIAALLGLGITGLALLQGRPVALTAPGIGALVLSLVALACAWHGNRALLLMGAVNLVLAVGLLLRAIRLDRTPRMSLPAQRAEQSDDAG